MEIKLFNELKAAFEETSNLLEDTNLSPEERKRLEILSAQLAGAMMSSWLPHDLTRRMFMLIVGLLTLYFFFQNLYILAIASLIIFCMFSPRIVGEITILIGKVKGN